MGWFFRTSKKEFDPIDFSVLKTDMHSHLLPNLDDGSSSIEDSIILVNQLNKLGFDSLITTPHIMSDHYKNTPDTINKALDKLKSEISEINVKVSAAAEYYVDYEFQQDIKKKKFLTFGQNFILVEFSFVSKPIKLKEIIFDLQVNGYTVVLAHPERYSYLSVRDLLLLNERGVLLQINLLSIIGYYSKSVKNKLKRIIDHNLVSFVGTDCHNIHQANLLHKCFTDPYWHKLVNSGKLLNCQL